MGILTDLNSGKKIKFDSEDSDLWGYNGTVLEQYVNNKLTGNTLTVNSVSETSITIDWGDIESTLQENQIIIE